MTKNGCPASHGRISPLWSVAFAGEQRLDALAQYVDLPLNAKTMETKAIRKAVERVGLSDEFVRGLFWDHGMALLQSIR